MIGEVERKLSEALAEIAIHGPVSPFPDEHDWSYRMLEANARLFHCEWEYLARLAKEALGEESASAP